MKFKFRAPLSTALAIGVGLIVLLGYFFGQSASGGLTLLGVLRNFFLQGAVIWAAVALIVGIANLASVHLRKIQKNQQAGYSFILLLSLILTVSVGIYDIFQTQFKGELNFQRLGWVFTNIQLPVETSLMAVLAISLTYAAGRLLARRLNLISVAFVGAVLLLIIGSMPIIATQAPFLTDLRSWILGVVTVAGTRGILLGIALGTIATGIRILTGSDRPYGS